MPLQDELDKMVGKKIVASAHEESDWYWVKFELNYGKFAIFRSAAPIVVEVVTEQ